MFFPPPSQWTETRYTELLEHITDKRKAAQTYHTFNVIYGRKVFDFVALHLVISR